MIIERTQLRRRRGSACALMSLSRHTSGHVTDRVGTRRVRGAAKVASLHVLLARRCSAVKQSYFEVRRMGDTRQLQSTAADAGP